MASIDENLGTNLSILLEEVTVFLTVTLDDLQLTPDQAAEKDTLINHLRALQDMLPSGEDKIEEPYQTGMSQIDVATTPAKFLYPTHCGWLHKRRKPGFIKSNFGPQKRWCCIKNGVFYYYIHDLSEKQKGSFYLEGYEVEEILAERANAERWLRLSKPGYRTYEFKVIDMDMQGWFNALNNATKETRRTLPPVPWEEPSDGIFDDNYDDVEAPPPNIIQQRQPIMPKIYYPCPPIPERPGRIISTRPYRPISEESENYETFDYNSDSSDDSYEDASSALAPVRSRKGISDCYNGSLIDEGFSSQASDRSNASSRSGASSGGFSTSKTNRGPLPNIPQIPLPDIPGKPQPPPKGSKQAFLMPRLKELKKVIGKPKGWNPKPEFYTKLYIACFDFHTHREDELSFKRGDLIKIVNTDFDQKKWWTGSKDGKYGLVPKTFLKEAYVH